MSNLFAQTSVKDSLVEFKAGVLHKDNDTKWVRADKRKGLVIVKRSADDQLIHFIWKDRSSGRVELDLILFPDDASFRRVKECTTGRVYVLEFKTGGKNFFWLQEPSTAKDDEYCELVNDHINNRVDDSSKSPSLANLLSQATSSSAASNFLERSQASSPSTRSLAGAKTTSAASATSTSATDSISSRFAQFMNSMPASSPQPRLTDVVNTQDVIATGLLKDKEILEELQKYLPENEKNSVEDTLRCPQFRQAVDTLNAALKQSPEALASLLASFGLKNPAQPGSSRLETFLQAISEQVKEEKSNDKNNENDKMEQ